MKPDSFGFSCSFVKATMIKSLMSIKTPMLHIYITKPLPPRWCDTELKCVLFSRKKAYPVLVVLSGEGTPYWACPSDTLTVSTGQCDFSCCQRGHVITTATQKIMTGKLSRAS